MRNEEKPLTDPSQPAHSEIRTSSPVDPSFTPFIILMPSFTLHSDEELSEVQHRAPSPTAAEPSTPIPTPALVQQPFSQRLAAKVKFLSRDRAEAITLDPKLAPVQGPLRPLSMVPGPSRKKRTTLFGLGPKYPRGHDKEPETEYEGQ